MKKILLSVFFLSTLGANAQTTIFQDSFDTYADFAIANIGSWTLVDVDLKTTYGFNAPTTFLNSGVAKSFQIFNSATTSPPLTASATSNWAPRTGSKNIVCFAAASPAPAINNDWLISPLITLGSTGNVVSFWAKSCDTQYGLEKFKVGVSSGNTTSNVTLLSTGSFVTTPANITYVQYSYAVPASFNGQSVYFSINCVSDDQFGFAVDDFRVTTTGLSSNDYFRNNFKVYPNPSADIVTLSNTSNIAIEAVEMTDINGRIVKTVATNAPSFSVRDLNSGVYFIKVTTVDGIGTTKFVKQ